MPQRAVVYLSEARLGMGSCSAWLCFHLPQFPKYALRAAMPQRCRQAGSPPRQDPCEPPALGLHPARPGEPRAPALPRRETGAAWHPPLGTGRVAGLRRCCSRIQAESRGPLCQSLRPPRSRSQAPFSRPAAAPPSLNIDFKYRNKLANPIQHAGGCTILRFCFQAAFTFGF